MPPSLAVKTRFPYRKRNMWAAAVQQAGRQEAGAGRLRGLLARSGLELKRKVGKANNKGMHLLIWVTRGVSPWTAPSYAVQNERSFTELFPMLGQRSFQDIVT